jgi:hypothetical protein
MMVSVMTQLCSACRVAGKRGLSDAYDDLGFSREHRDPLYQLFIQKMYEVRSQPLTELLTPEELQAQDALARAVVTELVKKERTDELSAVAQDLKLDLET